MGPVKSVPLFAWDEGAEGWDVAGWVFGVHCAVLLVFTLRRRSSSRRFHKLYARERQKPPTHILLLGL